MVALLHPHADAHTGTRSFPASAPSGLRLVVDNTKDSADAPGRISGELPAVDRSFVLTVIVAAVVIFGALFALRAVQGSPAVEAGQVDQAASPVVSAAAVEASGDQVIVAKAGDSMWSIAVSLDPEADPRPAVSALIDANGGDSVRIGQQIVIPKQLLD